MYITKNIELLKACRQLKNETNLIAVDTEFIRKFTYQPILCLVQIGYYRPSGDFIKLIIDPLAPKLNMTPLFSIMRNKSIKKIFHSSYQDIDSLAKIPPQYNINNMEDTQVMAEFAGFGTNLGYTTLVNQLLDKKIVKNKRTQTSNWKKRPLTKEQLTYAAGDIEYLIPIYNILLQKLKDYGNLAFYESEMKNMIRGKNVDYIVANAWKKLKFKLHHKSLFDIYLLKELCAWREKYAIEEDIIRNYVLTDEVLLKIVELKSLNIIDFRNNFIEQSKILEIPKSKRDEIATIIASMEKIHCEKLDKNLFYMREKSFPHKALFAEMEKSVKDICLARHIAPNRGLNTQEIISLIMKYETKRTILYGWKYTLFNDVITNLLKNKRKYAVNSRNNKKI